MSTFYNSKYLYNVDKDVHCTYILPAGVDRKMGEMNITDTPTSIDKLMVSFSQLEIMCPFSTDKLVLKFLSF